MENISGLKLKEPSIKVFLGEDVKFIQFPNDQKVKIYPLNLNDIAKIEAFSGIDFMDWENKNPFTKLSVLLYALWLSLRKDPQCKMSEEQLSEAFSIADVSAMSKIITEVLKLSGLEPADGSPQGNV